MPSATGSSGIVAASPGPRTTRRTGRIGSSRPGRTPGRVPPVRPSPSSSDAFSGVPPFRPSCDPPSMLSPEILLLTLSLAAAPMAQVTEAPIPGAAGDTAPTETEAHAQDVPVPPAGDAEVPAPGEEVPGPVA